MAERASDKPISVKLFWLSSLFITMTRMLAPSARLTDLLK